MKITLELRAISHKSPTASWGSNVYFFEDGACYPDQHTGNGLGWCSKEDIKKAIEEAQLAEKEKGNAEYKTRTSCARYEDSVIDKAQDRQEFRYGICE